MNSERSDITQTTSNQIRWTSADLELFPDSEWKRYEIVDGELFVTHAPHLGHQDSGGHIYKQQQKFITEFQ